MYSINLFFAIIIYLFLNSCFKKKVLIQKIPNYFTAKTHNISVLLIKKYIKNSNVN